jgi:hypothetical protein
LASEAQLLPATLEHAEALARTMRPEELAELRAVEMAPLEAVLHSMRTSTSPGPRSSTARSARCSAWGASPA